MTDTNEHAGLSGDALVSDKRDELLPCPFCGSADIYPTGWASLDDSCLACGDCGASAGTIGGKDNVASWNTRAALTAYTPRALEPAAVEADSQVERMGEALYDLSDRLRRIGALDSDNVHTAYEVVVKRWAELTNALTASGQGGGEVLQGEYEDEPAEWAVEAHRDANAAYAAYMGDPNDDGYDNPSEADRAAALAIQRAAIRALTTPPATDPAGREAEA